MRGADDEETEDKLIKAMKRKGARLNLEEVIQIVPKNFNGKHINQKVLQNCMDRHAVQQLMRESRHLSKSKGGRDSSLGEALKNSVVESKRRS